VRAARVSVELSASVKRGDGVVFEGNRAENAEQGSRVFEVIHNGTSIREPIAQGVVQLVFGHGAIDAGKLWPGQQVWKTDDPQLTIRLRKSFSFPQACRPEGISLRVDASPGNTLVVVAETEGGRTCRVESVEPLAEARRHPLNQETLREQFGRLGGTGYELRACEARIMGQPMAPLSVLGKLRHEMVRLLDVACAQREPRPVNANVLQTLRTPLPAAELATAPRKPVLHVLCRTLEQLRDVVQAGATSVMADLSDIRQYSAAVDLARAASASILIATPRIQKPDEMGLFRALVRHGADGILARNLSGIQFFAAEGLRVAADFSLNATNELTVEFLRRLGAFRVTASYDLNRDQLFDLVGSVPQSWLEVVMHQHMPMFHMEHCVFCSVLSPGTNKHNCGRPCDVHQVRLRDRIGKEHLLTADVGCRNTLYNAMPQSAAEAVPQLISRGVRDFRIELLPGAPPDEVARILQLYGRLLAGELSGKDVWTSLRAANRVGVTRGTLEERRNPLAIL
jgi:putative protease